jgi:hypothetical protein
MAAASEEPRIMQAMIVSCMEGTGTCCSKVMNNGVTGLKTAVLLESLAGIATKYHGHQRNIEKEYASTQNCN